MLSEDKPRTLVMMSVYNGEKYLAEQLESILQQDEIKPDVLVRDDGSDDQTAQILAEFSSKHPDRITVLTGANLGAAESFMEVLFSASTDYEYFAFSDADDVWLLSKLKSQIAYIRAMSTPTPARSVISRMEVVDANLSHLGYSEAPPRGFSFANAIAQCVFNGAASLFDRESMEVLRTERPQTVTMHDAWVYLVLSARATIGFSPIVALQYRQHQTNVIGGAPSWQLKFSRRWKRVAIRDPRRDEMLLEFARIHGPALDSEHARTLGRYLERYSSLRSRCKYIAHPTARMQRPIADAYHRILVTIKRG